ncbi:MAG: GntR family transcriptional regulator [bacterium]|nr:GntR family transcriptional regulator [bacterium]
MSSVVKTSMKQQVYEIIKEKILNQEYDLGDQINIITLGKELSVSNTPIREALARLNAEGLVTSSLNLKFRVITLTEDFCRELNQTILILELGAYENDVKLELTGKLADMLEERLAAQREALARRDYNEFIKAAIDFDRCFLAVLGNTRLLSVFDGLSTLLFLAVRYNHQKSAQNRENNILEHKELLDAVKNSRVSDVKGLMEKHYDKHYEIN